MVKRTFLTVCVAMSIASAVSGDTPLLVGVAKTDVTPSHAVRLSGYGSRRAESDGVEQRIWAKALAIGDAADAVVIITVDNLGVPETICAEIANRLKIPRQRLAVCSSHTHSAPMLTGVCPTLALHVLWDLPDGLRSAPDVAPSSFHRARKQTACSASMTRRYASTLPLLRWRAE